MKLKKIAIILIMFICIMMNINYVNASTLVVGDRTVDEIFTGADDFVKNANIVNTLDDKELRSVANDLYNILLALGMVILVIFGLIMGIKFMTSSVSEKAEIKQNMLPYFVGAVIILSAFGIWRVVIEIINRV